MVNGGQTTRSEMRGIESVTTPSLPPFPPPSGRLPACHAPIYAAPTLRGAQPQKIPSYNDL
ncbi:hypothetical protein [Nitrosomonas nitrosa]|uniref:hypothetical protein n=1 Tax=Nitrosomonas nitrosa TaxID=52442 RepID=UPI001958B23D|nr:hypothetical protein [Nitrosomonas nitrosa]